MTNRAGGAQIFWPQKDLDPASTIRHLDQIAEFLSGAGISSIRLDPFINEADCPQPARFA